MSNQNIRNTHLACTLDYPSVCCYPYPCYYYHALKKNFLFLSFRFQDLWKGSYLTIPVFPPNQVETVLISKMKTHGRLVTECDGIITVSNKCLYTTGTQTMLMCRPMTQYLGAKLQIKPVGGTLPHSQLFCTHPKVVNLLFRGKRASNATVSPLLAGPNHARLYKSVMSSQVASSRGLSQGKDWKKKKNMLPTPRFTI